MKITRKLILRMISFVLIFCFSINQISWSQPSIGILPFSRENPTLNQLSHFHIPEELGTISKILPSPLGSKAPLILHIQDAHGSYEAQTNIQKILGYLVQKYGFSLILLEGAAHELNPDLFKIFKDSKINQDFAHELAKQGHLTGAELYLLEAKKNVIGQGIEFDRAYFQNFKLLQQLIHDEPNSNQFISQLRSKIDKVGSLKFNHDLRSFFKTWQSWQDAQLDLNAYLSYVQAQAEKFLGKDLENAKHQSEFPMLVRYFKSKNIESKINFDLAEQERQKLTAFLKQHKVKKELINKLENWHLHNGLQEWKDELPRQFLERLHEASNSYGFKFNDFPALTSVWASLIFLSELSSEDLFQEIEKLTSLLFTHLTTNDEEKQIVSLIQDSIVLQKLLLFKLTRDEYQNILASKQYDLDSALNRLQKMTKDSLFSKQTVRSMNHRLNKAKAFYRVAEQREHFLVSNSEKMMKSKKTNKAILISGGFHSAGLRDQFQKKNFSYIEIMPRITKFDGIDQIYRNAALERSTMLLALLMDQIYLIRFRPNINTFERVLNRMKLLPSDINDLKTSELADVLNLNAEQLRNGHVKLQVKPPVPLVPFLAGLRLFEPIGSERTGFAFRRAEVRIQGKWRYIAIAGVVGLGIGVGSFELLKNIRQARQEEEIRALPVEVKSKLSDEPNLEAETLPVFLNIIVILIGLAYQNLDTDRAATEKYLARAIQRTLILLRQENPPDFVDVLAHVDLVKVNGAHKEIEAIIQEGKKGKFDPELLKGIEIIFEGIKEKSRPRQILKRLETEFNEKSLDRFIKRSEMRAESAYALLDVVIPLVYDHASEIINFDKKGLRFPYALLDVADYEGLREGRPVLEERVKSAGGAFLHYSEARDRSYLFVDRTLVPEAFREIVAVHEYTESIFGIGRDDIAILSELEFARRERRLNPYLNWLEQSLPERYRKLKDMAHTHDPRIILEPFGSGHLKEELRSSKRDQYGTKERLMRARVILKLLRDFKWPRKLTAKAKLKDPFTEWINRAETRTLASSMLNQIWPVDNPISPYPLRYPKGAQNQLDDETTRRIAVNALSVFADDAYLHLGFPADTKFSGTFLKMGNFLQIMRIDINGAPSNFVMEIPMYFDERMETISQNSANFRYYRGQRRTRFLPRPYYSYRGEIDFQGRSITHPVAVHEFFEGHHELNVGSGRMRYWDVSRLEDPFVPFSAQETANLLAEIIAAIVYFYEPDLDGGTTIADVHVNSGDFIRKRDSQGKDELRLITIRNRRRGVDIPWFIYSLIQLATEEEQVPDREKVYSNKKTAYTIPIPILISNPSIAFHGIERGLRYLYQDQGVPDFGKKAEADARLWLNQFSNSYWGRNYQRLVSLYLQGQSPLAFGGDPLEGRPSKRWLTIALEQLRKIPLTDKNREEIARRIVYVEQRTKELYPVKPPGVRDPMEILLEEILTSKEVGVKLPEPVVFLSSLKKMAPVLNRIQGRQFDRADIKNALRKAPFKIRQNKKIDLIAEKLNQRLGRRSEMRMLGRSQASSLHELFGNQKMKRIMDFATGDGSWPRQLEESKSEFSWLSSASDAEFFGVELAKPTNYPEYPRKGIDLEKLFARLENKIKIISSESDEAFPPDQTIDLLHASFMDNSAQTQTDLERYEKKLRSGGWILIAGSDKRLSPRRVFISWLLGQGYRREAIHVFDSETGFPPDYPKSWWWENFSPVKRYHFLIAAQKNPEAQTQMSQAEELLEEVIWVLERKHEDKFRVANEKRKQLIQFDGIDIDLAKQLAGRLFQGEFSDRIRKAKISREEIILALDRIIREVSRAETRNAGTAAVSGPLQIGEVFKSERNSYRIKVILYQREDLGVYVYEGQNLKTDKPVVLNVQTFSSDGDAKKIKYLKLRHEHEVRILKRWAKGGLPYSPIFYDAAIDESKRLLWIALERIDSQSLHDWAQGQTQAKLLDKIEEILDALHKLHKLGIQHRDLTSENIRIDHKNKVRIINFGPSQFGRKFFRPVSHSFGRTPNSIYAAPEMRTFEMKTTRAVDLFSLGIIMFELATGLPFWMPESKISFPEFYARNQLMPSSKKLMARLRHTSWDPFAEVIAKTLSPNPKDRYKSARQMKKAIQSVRMSVRTQATLISEDDSLVWQLRMWGAIYRLFLRPYVTVKGIENLPKNGAFILAGPHVNFLDGLFVATEMHFRTGRLPLFIARPEHLGLLQRILIRKGGALVVSPGETPQKMKEYLQRGWILGIFPGGRVAEPAFALQNWKDSVAQVATATGVPIVPFGVRWKHAPFKGVSKNWKELFYSSAALHFSLPNFESTISIGKPILANGKAHDDLMRELQSQVSALLSRAEMRTNLINGRAGKWTIATAAFLVSLTTFAFFQRPDKRPKLPASSSSEKPVLSPAEEQIKAVRSLLNLSEKFPIMITPLAEGFLFADVEITPNPYTAIRFKVNLETKKVSSGALDYMDVREQLPLIVKAVTDLQSLPAFAGYRPRLLTALMGEDRTEIMALFDEHNKQVLWFGQPDQLSRFKIVNFKQEGDDKFFLIQTSDGQTFSLSGYLGGKWIKGNRAVDLGALQLVFSRSEARATPEEGELDSKQRSKLPIQNFGFGNFSVMVDGNEVHERQLKLDQDSDLSFYFNIYTDVVLQDPSQQILARVYYEKSPGLWFYDLPMKHFDNFQNGVYRVGITLPQSLTGSLTFQYSLDLGVTWQFANYGPQDDFKILRPNEIQKEDEEKDFYAIDYHPVLEQTKVQAEKPSETEEPSKAEIPIEVPPSEEALFRAWLARQTPGREANKTFRELREKYPNLTSNVIRKTLGEQYIKPKEGFPKVDVSFREMRDQDVDEVVKIEEALFEEPNRWSRWGFTRDDKGDDTKEERDGGLLDQEEEKNLVKRYVAIVNDQVVGYLVFKIFDERIDIQKIVADPAFRFSSIGKMFINHVKTVMNENSLSFIAVAVPKDETAVVRYFEKQSFVKLEEQDRSWDKKNNADLVYWHPEIEATMLRNKKQAARYFRWIKQAKAKMEEVEKKRLEKSPKSILKQLKTNENHPWKGIAGLNKHGFGKLSIREARLKNVEELVRFSKTTSRFEWTADHFRNFINKGGKILIARSYGQIVGFLAVFQEDKVYEIGDVAFLPDARLSTLFKKLTQKLDVLSKDSPKRFIWEITEEEFNDLDGGKSLVRDLRFRVLDVYDRKEESSSVTVYLLEKRLLEFPETEKLFHAWAQSLERSPIAYEAVVSQAEEFGVTVDFAYETLKDYGVKILPPEQGQPKKTKPSVPENRETLRVHIRWMIRRDMPEVLQIENESYKDGWTEEDFLRALRQRNVIGMVAEQGEKVVGFMIYELHRRRLEVLNLAVSPRFRWHRIGEQLIDKLKDKLNSHRRTRIRFILREANLSAQLFFRRNEFKAVRILKNYFDDTGEDAFIFDYIIPGTETEDVIEVQSEEEWEFESLSGTNEPPSHPKILQGRLLYAWAKRQPLNNLEDAVVYNRYPKVLLQARNRILNPIRKEKLAEMLQVSITPESSQTVPYHLDDLSELSHLPAGQVFQVLRELGLKAADENYPPLKIKVRKSQESDFNRFESIDHANSFSKKQAWTYSDFQTAHNKGFHFLTAIYDSRVVGYVLYRERKGRFEILRLTVLPNLQFRKIEQQLIKGVKNEMRLKRGFLISTEVPERNLYGQMLLRDENFVSVGKKYGPRGKKLSFIYKRKFLTEQRVQEILREVSRIFLRYQEGALVLHLERRGKKPILLRSKTSNFDGLLKRWFDLETVVRETETLSWYDSDIEYWITRSLKSPVEIKQIEKMIFKRIQKIQKVKVSEAEINKNQDKGPSRAEMGSDVNEKGKDWFAPIRRKNWQFSSPREFAIGMGADSKDVEEVIQTIIRRRAFFEDWGLDWAKFWEAKANREPELTKKFQELYVAAGYLHNSLLSYRRKARQLSKRIRELFPAAIKAEFANGNRAPPLEEPIIEFVKVPYYSHSMPGVFVLPQNASAVGVQIFLHGLDQTKEQPTFLPMIREAIENGYAVLIVDLPGHGENEEVMGGPEEFEEIVRVLIDFVKRDGRIDPEHIRALGFSFGGYGVSRALLNDENNRDLEVVFAINPPIRNIFLLSFRSLFYAWTKRKFFAQMFGTTSYWQTLTKLLSFALSHEEIDKLNARGSKIVVVAGKGDYLIPPADRNLFNKVKTFPGGHYLVGMLDQVARYIMTYQPPEGEGNELLYDTALERYEDKTFPRAETRAQDLDLASLIGERTLEKFTELNQGKPLSVLSLSKTPTSSISELDRTLETLPENSFVALAIHEKKPEEEKYRLVIDTVKNIRRQTLKFGIWDGTISLRTLEFLFVFQVFPGQKRIHLDRASVGSEHKDDLIGQGVMSEIFGNLSRELIRKGYTSWKVEGVIAEHYYKDKGEFLVLQHLMKREFSARRIWRLSQFLLGKDSNRYVGRVGARSVRAETRSYEFKPGDRLALGSQVGIANGGALDWSLRKTFENQKVYYLKAIPRESKGVVKQRWVFGLSDDVKDPIVYFYPALETMDNKVEILEAPEGEIIPLEVKMGGNDYVQFKGPFVLEKKRDYTPSTRFGVYFDNHVFSILPNRSFIVHLYSLARAEVRTMEGKLGEYEIDKLEQVSELVKEIQTALSAAFWDEIADLKQDHISRSNVFFIDPNGNALHKILLSDFFDERRLSSIAQRLQAILLHFSEQLWGPKHRNGIVELKRQSRFGGMAVDFYITFKPINERIASRAEVRSQYDILKFQRPGTPTPETRVFKVSSKVLRAGGLLGAIQKNPDGTSLFEFLGYPRTSEGRTAYEYLIHELNEAIKQYGKIVGDPQAIRGVSSIEVRVDTHTVLILARDREAYIAFAIKPADPLNDHVAASYFELRYKNLQSEELGPYRLRIRTDIPSSSEIYYSYFPQERFAAVYILGLKAIPLSGKGKLHKKPHIRKKFNQLYRSIRSFASQSSIERNYVELEHLLNFFAGLFQETEEVETYLWRRAAELAFNPSNQYNPDTMIPSFLQAVDELYAWASPRRRAEVRMKTDQYQIISSLGVFPWDQVQDKLREFKNDPALAIQALAGAVPDRFSGSTLLRDFERGYQHLLMTKENLERIQKTKITTAEIFLAKVRVPEKGGLYPGLLIMFLPLEPQLNRFRNSLLYNLEHLLNLGKSREQKWQFEKVELLNHDDTVLFTFQRTDDANEIKAQVDQVIEWLQKNEKEGQFPKGSDYYVTRWSQRDRFTGQLWVVYTGPVEDELKNVAPEIKMRVGGALNGKTPPIRLTINQQLKIRLADVFAVITPVGHGVIRMAMPPYFEISSINHNHEHTIINPHREIILRQGRFFLFRYRGFQKNERTTPLLLTVEKIEDDAVVFDIWSSRTTDLYLEPRIENFPRSEARSQKRPKRYGRRIWGDQVSSLPAFVGYEIKQTLFDPETGLNPGLAFYIKELPVVITPMLEAVANYLNQTFWRGEYSTEYLANLITAKLKDEPTNDFGERLHVDIGFIVNPILQVIENFVNSTSTNRHNNQSLSDLDEKLRGRRRHLTVRAEVRAWSLRQQKELDEELEKGVEAVFKVYLMPLSSSDKNHSWLRVTNDGSIQVIHRDPNSGSESIQGKPIYPYKLFQKGRMFTASRIAQVMNFKGIGLGQINIRYDGDRQRISTDVKDLQAFLKQFFLEELGKDQTHSSLVGRAIHYSNIQTLPRTIEFVLPRAETRSQEDRFKIVERVLEIMQHQYHFSNDAREIVSQYLLGGRISLEEAANKIGIELLTLAKKIFDLEEVIIALRFLVNEYQKDKNNPKFSGAIKFFDRLDLISEQEMRLTQSPDELEKLLQLVLTSDLLRFHDSLWNTSHDFNEKAEPFFSLLTRFRGNYPKVWEVYEYQVKVAEFLGENWNEKNPPEPSVFSESIEPENGKEIPSFSGLVSKYIYEWARIIKVDQRYFYILAGDHVWSAPLGDIKEIDTLVEYTSKKKLPRFAKALVSFPKSDYKIGFVFKNSEDKRPLFINQGSKSIQVSLFKVLLPPELLHPQFRSEARMAGKWKMENRPRKFSVAEPMNLRNAISKAAVLQRTFEARKEAQLLQQLKVLEVSIQTGIKKFRTNVPFMLQLLKDLKKVKGSFLLRPIESVLYSKYADWIQSADVQIDERDENALAIHIGGLDPIELNSEETAPAELFGRLQELKEQGKIEFLVPIKEKNGHLYFGKQNSVEPITIYQVDNLRMLLSLSLSVRSEVRGKHVKEDEFTDFNTRLGIAGNLLEQLIGAISAWRASEEKILDEELPRNMNLRTRLTDSLGRAKIRLEKARKAPRPRAFIRIIVENLRRLHIPESKEGSTLRVAAKQLETIIDHLEIAQKQEEFRRSEVRSTEEPKKRTLVSKERKVEASFAAMPAPEFSIHDVRNEMQDSELEKLRKKTNSALLRLSILNKRNDFGAFHRQANTFVERAAALKVESASRQIQPNIAPWIEKFNEVVNLYRDRVSFKGEEKKQFLDLKTRLRQIQSSARAETRDHFEKIIKLQDTDMDTNWLQIQVAIPKESSFYSIVLIPRMLPKTEDINNLKTHSRVGTRTFVKTRIQDPIRAEETFNRIIDEAKRVLSRRKKIVPFGTEYSAFTLWVRNNFYGARSETRVNVGEIVEVEVGLLVTTINRLRDELVQKAGNNKDVTISMHSEDGGAKYTTVYSSGKIISGERDLGTAVLNNIKARDKAPGSRYQLTIISDREISYQKVLSAMQAEVDMHHFRVESVSESSPKDYILFAEDPNRPGTLDPKRSHYFSRLLEKDPRVFKPGENPQHDLVVQKFEAAKAHILARAKELNNQEMTERAELLGGPVTVTLIHGPTRLFTYRPEDKTVGVYHTDLEKGALEFLEKFIDSIRLDHPEEIEELAFYMDRGLKRIVAYMQAQKDLRTHLIEPHEIVDRLREVRKKFATEDRQFTKSGNLESIFERLKMLSELDKNEAGERVARIRKLRSDLKKTKKELKAKIDAGKFPGREKLKELAVQYGDLAHMEFNEDFFVLASKTYENKIEILRWIQAGPDMAPYPLQIQEQILWIELKAGLYNRFLQDLKVFLTGRGFPKGPTRPEAGLWREERNMLATFIRYASTRIGEEEDKGQVLHFDRSFEGELISILREKEDLVSSWQYEKFRIIEDEIKQLFKEARENIGDRRDGRWYRDSDLEFKPYREPTHSDLTTRNFEVEINQKSKGEPVHLGILIAYMDQSKAPDEKGIESFLNLIRNRATLAAAELKLQRPVLIHISYTVGESALLERLEKKNQPLDAFIITGALQAKETVKGKLQSWEPRDVKQNISQLGLDFLKKVLQRHLRAEVRNFIKVNSTIKPEPRAVLFDFDGTLSDTLELQYQAFGRLYYWIVDAGTKGDPSETELKAGRDFLDATMGKLASTQIRTMMEESKKRGVSENQWRSVLKNLSFIYGVEAKVKLLITSGKGLEDFILAFSIIYEAFLIQAVEKNPPQPLPGVLDFLSTLYKAGIPMYVGTGTVRSLADKVLQKWGVRYQFQDVYGTVVDGPSPFLRGKSDMLEQIRNRHQLTKNKVFIFGDGSGDMQASWLYGDQEQGKNRKKFVAVGITKKDEKLADKLIDSGADFLIPSLENLDFYWKLLGFPSRRAEVRKKTPTIKFDAKTQVEVEERKLPVFSRTTAKQFEDQFHRNFESFTRVTLEVAEGIIDLAILRSPLGVVILGWLSKNSEAEPIELPPISLDSRWTSAFELFIKQLSANGIASLDQPSGTERLSGRPPLEQSASAALPRNDDQKHLSVVIEASNPISKFLLDTEIVRSILKSPIKVLIADSDQQFKSMVEKRVIKLLNPQEQNQFLNHFKINRKSLSILSSEQMTQGAGVLVENQKKLAELNRLIAVTLVDIEKLNPQEAGKIVVPILLIAAKLGSLASGQKLTEAELVPLRRQLSDFGIEISSSNGQVISTVLVQVLRQWFAEEEARQAQLIAA